MGAKSLQVQVEYGKIKTNQRWIMCPGCGKKLMRVMPTTFARNLPLFCRRCGMETIVNIESTQES